MNPSKRGLSSAGKAGVVVVLIVIVLGAVYLVPSLSKGSGNQSASSNSNTEPITSMYSLIGDFSKMQVMLDAYDAPDGIVTNQSTAYTVLGGATQTTTTTTTLANGQTSTSTNSSQYTRVEFTTIGAGNDVVAWYNSSGGIGDEEVLGERNYTGNGVNNLPFMDPYTSSFGSLVSITDNATLLSLLTKTTEATMSIGPTQMDVTTYVLPGRTSEYTSITAKIATIPGTDVQFAVYLNEEIRDGSTTLLEVTSLTR
jgi:hypothetical protein